METSDQSVVDLDHGVREYDQDVGIDVRFGQCHRAGRAILHLLEHVVREQIGIVLRNPGFDGFAQVSNYEDHIFDAELHQVVEDEAQHGLPRNLQQRLGGTQREWPEARALPGQGDDGFHRVRA